MKPQRYYLWGFIFKSIKLYLISNMKDLFRLFGRFIPPYKKYMVLNIIFNLFGAVFGAFSFMFLIPILGVLFKTESYVKLASVPEPAISMKYFQGLTNFHIVNLIEAHGESFTLLLIGVVLIVMVLLKTGFTYLASYNIVPIRNGVVKDLRGMINRKILDLPLGFFSDERKGDIMARMTGDVLEVENSIMNSLEMLFKNPILIIVQLGLMLAMSWELTLFVFVLLPIAGTIIGRIGKNLKKSSAKAQNKMGEILSTIDETLAGLRIIKAFNAEKKIDDRFSQQNDQYKSVMNSLMRRNYLAQPTSEFLGTTVIVVVLWYGGSLVLKNESSLTAEQFMAYLVLFYGIINPAKAFSRTMYSIQKGMASINRIDKILYAKSDIEDPKTPAIIEDFGSEIEYKNVSFKYTDNYVLKDVNVKIAKGKTVALVGQSGSGKTTFVDLLPRFYDVNKGSILVDGIDIKDLKLHDLRSIMGNVNQESILFNDTFFNNIAFGVENASKDEVVEAAKIANAHDFIIDTEGGYEANIGDRGGKLSGGQRQRISIARAVLKNPPILILDEATSALDTESERLVQEALENLMKNRTTIVIAHRLSTVRNADEICVFNEGEIVERGKHDDLIIQNGVYKKLHDIQMN